MQLALETTVLTMLLMVPTVYWVHLRLPKVRPAVELVSILPLVTPPIVLVVGLLDVYRGRAPEWFIDSPKFLVTAYVVICLPFVYRALDAGIRAVDIHTLTDAAQSLGASRTRTLVRVILPNLRGAVAIACLLCFVIVLGEYTIASIALWETFPVYITFIGTSQAYGAAALSIISVFLTFGAALVFVMLARIGRSPRAAARAPFCRYPADHVDPPRPLRAMPHLELKELRKRFAGNQALDGVDVALGPGRARVAARPERLRQDHRVALRRRIPAAGHGSDRDRRR